MIVHSRTNNYPNVHREPPPMELMPQLAFEDVVTLHAMSRFEVTRDRIPSNMPVALMRLPDGQRYIMSDLEMKEAQFWHMGEYSLPYVQHARHALKNYKTDRRVEAIANTIEEIGVAGSVIGAIGFGLAVAAATVVNYTGNHLATRYFNDTATAQVQGTSFQVRTDNMTAAIGKPEANGVAWDFEGDKPIACTVRQHGKDEMKGKLLSLSWMDHSYDRECRVVEAWPAESAQQKLYAPAYQAYLQTAQPNAKHTPESVQKIIDARRAFEAVRP